MKRQLVENPKESQEIKDDLTAAYALLHGLDPENCVEAPTGSTKDETGGSNEEEEEEKTDYIQWNLKGESKYIPVGVLKTTPKVVPGIYKILHNNDWGHYLSKQHISLDELFVLPQSEQKLILDDITKFWQREAEFKKYKYNYKRGILLFGPAGNGKSSIINLLVDKIIQFHSGVVFYLNTTSELETFCFFINAMFRQIEKNTPILCVLEDLETLTRHHESETLLLNTLDGAAQMSNIVFLGCTNYPEELKERILNRPNRFDRRYYIGPPSNEVRRFYFEKKLKSEDLKSIDLELWVKETEGLSIAHLGEMIKSVFVLGNTFEDILEEFEKMKQKITSYNFGKETKSLGFNSNNKKH